MADAWRDLEHGPRLNIGWARLFDRSLGAYLGFAVGDALGATVEFMTAAEIAKRYGQHRDMVGGGWLKLKAGQVTDDTTMTLALGEALLRVQAEQPDDPTPGIAQAFVQWWQSKPVDCGNTCRRGIMRYIADGSLQAPLNEGDGGNGALMRNLPAALITLGQPHALAPLSLAQARFTHHHPLSDAATLAFGEMLHILLGEAEPQNVMPACHALAKAWLRRHPVFRFEPYPGRVSGYVVDTVQTVWHHFFFSDDFESAVLGAVNCGGDADTNGALVGMLAGARWGAHAIPARWLSKLDAGVRLQITQQTCGLLSATARQ